MEINSIDLENAYLAWINHLEIVPQEFTSILQLKDGTLFLKLLNPVYVLVLIE